jgi:hypothetical protein
MTETDTDTDTVVKAGPLEVVGMRVVWAAKVLSALMLVVTVANAWIGREVNRKVDDLTRHMAQSDSLSHAREIRAEARFERLGTVLELQATAIVEGKESEEGREAQRQLRSLRRVLPQ